MPKLEARFQREVIERIERRFPGAVILKTDPSYIWSIPDLFVVRNKGWAALETKRTPDSSERPNQGYYVNLFNDMSYGSFVNPNNIRRVLYDLERTL